MFRRPLTTALLAIPLLAGCCTASALQVADEPDPNWRTAEGDMLADHIQLTHADRFFKAGEAYFSPDGARIIFQGIEQPEAGATRDDFYAMYVADVLRTSEGLISGLSNIRRLSPPGSANTCGWFHPTDPNIVIFASTVETPSDEDPPGWVPESGRYRWMFPREMRIFKCDLRTADGTADSLELLVGDLSAYQAEGALSPDGRHLVYCSLASNEGDLFVYDLETGTTARIVQARGYDGGPFFSPDGERICYRSDRQGNSQLQLFVADLAFNDYGEIVGIEREYQLTDNEHVNWCPFWHPDGRHLVYATSRMSHFNYEVFMVDADPGNLQGSTGSIKYGTKQRRITQADRADVLPAFSPDGRWFLWTSQRGEDGESQLWVARFIAPLDRHTAAERTAETDAAGQGDAEQAPDFIHVVDPDTGTIYIYEPDTHDVKTYDPATHQTSLVTDPEELKRVMDLFRDR